MISTIMYQLMLKIFTVAPKEQKRINKHECQRTSLTQPQNPAYPDRAVAKSIAGIITPEHLYRHPRRACVFFCASVSATLRYGGWAGPPSGGPVS